MPEDVCFWFFLQNSLSESHNLALTFELTVNIDQLNKKKIAYMKELQQLN